MKQLAKLTKAVPTLTFDLAPGTLVMADLHQDGSGKANLFGLAGELMLVSDAADCFEIIGGKPRPE